MNVRELISILVALSFSVVISAQAPPPKPKPPSEKPATSQKAPPKGRKALPEPAPAPAPPPPPTDVQLRTSYTTGAQVSENRTYIRGARQRFEFPGITVITQCDMERSLWINDATKQYMEVSTAPRPAVSPSPADLPQDAESSEQAPDASESKDGKARGGVITERVTLTDTGERKQMFGLEARRIKTVVAREPGENACQTTITTVETDGWYVDLPERPSCPGVAAARPPIPAAETTCTDRVVTENTGSADIGFALSTTMTTTVTETKGRDRDREPAVTSMAMEVTDLKVTSLDAALFEVPAGYARVEDSQSFLASLAAGGSLSEALFGSIASGTSTVAPKKAGVIRVGVVTPANRSGREVPADRLVGGLFDGFTHEPFESLPLTGSTAADLYRDAVEKSCDYVLFSDIAAIKTSKPNRVGGWLKKVANDGPPPSEIHEVRIDYRLHAVGDPEKARITSSANASSGGGFGLRSALRVAAFAGQMYLTMGMGSGLMGMLGIDSPFGGLMGGFGDGVLGQRTNPGMSAAFSILSAAGDMAADDGQSAAEEDPAGKVTQTVHEGLSKASRQVAEELRKTRAATAQGNKE
ncbi:hypothetical protein BH23ACI1_BH23ACI1_30650 [soil metagenome]